MEPASSPMWGSSPSRVARPTPRVFCTSSRPVTTSRKVATALPPRLRLPRSAERPMGGEEGQHQGRLQAGIKLQFDLQGGTQHQQHQGNHQPPATGLGMLKVRRGPILLTSRRQAAAPGSRRPGWRRHQVVAFSAPMLIGCVFGEKRLTDPAGMKQSGERASDRGPQPRPSAKRVDTSPCSSGVQMRFVKNPPDTSKNTKYIHICHIND